MNRYAVQVFPWVVILVGSLVALAYLLFGPGGRS